MNPPVEETTRDKTFFDMLPEGEGESIEQSIEQQCFSLSMLNFEFLDEETDDVDGRVLATLSSSSSSASGGSSGSPWGTGDVGLFFDTNWPPLENEPSSRPPSVDVTVGSPIEQQLQGEPMPSTSAVIIGAGGNNTGFVSINGRGAQGQLQGQLKQGQMRGQQPKQMYNQGQNQAFGIQQQQQQIQHKYPFRPFQAGKRIEGLRYPLDPRKIQPPSNSNCDECAFCKGNKAAECVYKSHPLRLNGRVTCPILRMKRCNLCNLTGDLAHTVKYCPFNTKGFFANVAIENERHMKRIMEAAKRERERINMRAAANQSMNNDYGQWNVYIHAREQAQMLVNGYGPIGTRGFGQDMTIPPPNMPSSSAAGNGAGQSTFGDVNQRRVKQH